MSQANLDLIDRAYQAFGRGDIPGVLAMFAERLDHFGITADGPTKAPWHVGARTRAEVGAYFGALVGALEPVSFEYLHLAAGGDFVYATTNQTFRVRATGKLFVKRDAFHRFQVVDGMITGWIANEDTALASAALVG